MPNKLLCTANVEQMYYERIALQSKTGLKLHQNALSWAKPCIPRCQDVSLCEQEEHSYLNPALTVLSKTHMQESSPQCELSDDKHMCKVSARGLDSGVFSTFVTHKIREMLLMQGNLQLY